MNQILAELEVEKKRGDELTAIRKASQSQYWWEAPIDELDPSQLVELKGCLQNLKNKVILQAQNVVMQQPSTCCQYFGESSSSGGIAQVHDPNNTSNNNMVLPPPPPPPPMVQSASPSQYFAGNSSTEGVNNIPIDPMDYNFNPSYMNVMPSPPPPPPPSPPHDHYHLPPPPPPPQHPDPDHSGFNHRFY